jgi:S-methylmethionine-dependent homocysteine/selenocysteine methylase
MNFEKCYNESRALLMEGAVAERIKHEFAIKINDKVALADLIYKKKSRQALTEIYTQYLHIAEKYHLPLIVTTPTRRANRIHVYEAGYDEGIIYENVTFLRDIQKSAKTEMYVGGLMGCKGDAYKATEVLTTNEAYNFHRWQADLFKKAHVDFLFAGIMPALSEAVGMAQVMESTEIPYIISFMIKKNGKLIDGTTINNAIKEIDSATKRKPICYMANCVHPRVLQEALLCSFNQTETVKQRFHGIQANTSVLSPEELDNSNELVTSDSIDLANDMMKLSNIINIKMYGGCCGTDNSHIEEIARRINGES